ncbi:glutathione S-transferase [Duganella sp. CF517]|uniref:glutathione binding-like protein n=1 Tax=Duganella sp. CF517 TaxID=1881038 RepID=UPI0008AFF119|nr:glutathione binding-like protein [Duganella sp. CF517]SEO53867.1 glutathione S-transferase [Duganella sp. CF517]
MKLYHMPGACSLADLIVLDWIGAPHQAIRMDLDSIKSPHYLAINAGGNVPLLVHGDFLLTENVAILGYLADLHPGAALLGDGSARGRAEVMRWLGFLNSDVHKAFKPLFSPARFLDERDRDDALARNARHHVRLYLERLEAHMDGREWLTGARSVADPYLFVVLRWAEAKLVDLHGLPNLARFSDRMARDPGVRAALRAEQA